MAKGNGKKAAARVGKLAAMRLRHRAEENQLAWEALANQGWVLVAAAKSLGDPVSTLQAIIYRNPELRTQYEEALGDRRVAAQEERIAEAKRDLEAQKKGKAASGAVVTLRKHQWREERRRAGERVT